MKSVVAITQAWLQTTDRVGSKFIKFGGELSVGNK